MRKRIAIALLAIVAVGFLAFFISQPKKGTVEWHKREYLAAVKGTWAERAQNAWNGVSGRQRVPSDDRIEGIRKHRQALIDVGFLEERQFDLTNRNVFTVIGEVHKAVHANPPTDPELARVRREFILIEPSTMRIVLVARRADMPKLAETIRKADVP